MSLTAAVRPREKTCVMFDMVKVFNSDFSEGRSLQLPCLNKILNILNKYEVIKYYIVKVIDLEMVNESFVHADEK